MLRSSVITFTPALISLPIAAMDGALGSYPEIWF
jgi:hypothetical protein